jgi:hypothetical protein
MTLRDKLIELVDELLKLFEDGNKLVYKRLIVLRHCVRNKLSPDEIYNDAYKFYCANSSRFENKDLGVFKSLPFYPDIELVWSELSASNKNLVWCWVDSIVAESL